LPKEITTGSNEASNVKAKNIHQCTDCGTIYDQDFGDEYNNIAKNTPFEELPSIFECPVCGAGKEKFEQIELSLEENLI
jgi:rubredoxin